MRQCWPTDRQPRGRLLQWGRHPAYIWQRRSTVSFHVWLKTYSSTFNELKLGRLGALFNNYDVKLIFILFNVSVTATAPTSFTSSIWNCTVKK